MATLRMAESKSEPLVIELVPIDSIHEDAANARRHPERNLKAIKGSLTRFGMRKPIVVDVDGIVRAGNGTLAAAKSLGWKEIAIVRTALHGTETTAFSLADNRTAELAEWADEVLAGFLSNNDLGDVGFNADEIANLTQLPLDANGKEYDESIEEDVEIVKCPQCGHEFLK